MLIVTALVMAFAGPGCDAASAKQDPPAAPGVKSAPPAEPAEGQSVRVGGEAAAEVTKTDGVYRSGPCLIETPLPVGYPAPTAPGAVELKRYPGVRRAEVTGTSSPELGMNVAFFPLFFHIKERNIAMTSPVEMNFTGTAEGVPEGGDAQPRTWTMSFLYRSADLGPTGPDEKRKNVKVVDVPPVTVVALGVRGPYGYARMRREWAKLESWLAGQGGWEADGEPRVLYYNGPDVRSADKWAEVQIPVKPASTKPAGQPSDSAAQPAAAPEAPVQQPATEPAAH
jgi:hypothetical protein